MRCRHYHLRLDRSPVWGAVLGFGMDRREMHWVQTSDWWQMMVVGFGGVLTVNGSPTPFWPGSMLVVPPGARCLLERSAGENITQHWLKFRPDEEATHVVAIPQVRAFGAEYGFIESQFRACLDNLVHCRNRLDVMGWNLLWSVSENAAVVPEDPILGQVEALIRANLACPLEIESIAREVGVGTARLSSRFREHYGQSIPDYVRTLRMQQACALLVNTDRPIKEIAVKVGYADLQRFNKVVRETFGCSPRALRQDCPSVGVHALGGEESSRRRSYLESEPGLDP